MNIMIIRQYSFEIKPKNTGVSPIFYINIQCLKLGPLSKCRQLFVVSMWSKGGNTMRKCLCMHGKVTNTILSERGLKFQFIQTPLGRHLLFPLPCNS